VLVDQRGAKFRCVGDRRLDVLDQNVRHPLIRAAVDAMDAGDRLAVVFQEGVAGSRRVGGPAYEPTVERNRAIGIRRSQNGGAEGSAHLHR
jgi:hypothetical protein